METSLLNVFKIQTKQATSIYFNHNRIQRHYEQRKTKRDIVLKARQHGFTTYVQLSFLHKCILNENVNCLTVSDTVPHAVDIFNKIHYAIKNLPDWMIEELMLDTKNVRRISFGLNDSALSVSTSGRSGTLHGLHISEFAFMRQQQKDEVMEGSLQALTSNGSCVIESTANGMEDFYALYTASKEGQTEWKAHFYPWHWNDDYQRQAPEQQEWKEMYKEEAKKHGLRADIQDEFKLSDSQLFWYYNKARTLKKAIREEFPTTDLEAFLSTGRNVFSLSILQKLKPRFHAKTYKQVKIFEEVQSNEKYTIGIDTATGRGEDYSSMVVLKKNTWEVVATYRDKTITPDKLAIIAMELSKKYNEAFLVPEVNNSGLTTVLKLKELGFYNMYREKDIDKVTNKTRNKWGWTTTSANRDLMIDDCVELFEEGALIIPCDDILKEMAVFIITSNFKRKKYRREAQQGYHDDMLFALFLAVQGCKRHQEQALEIINW